MLQSKDRPSKVFLRREKFIYRESNIGLGIDFGVHVTKTLRLRYQYASKSLKTVSNFIKTFTFSDYLGVELECLAVI